ncbi:murein biosynthesis integral membrane protein MurJ [Pseudomonas aegrilactucae]|nr:lipid II flippase MurJ [Pseudomonas aegrilactucae]
MAGRLAGFGREVLLASSLGLSEQADIAIVLLTVPDLLVNLLLSGGIGVALVPAMRAATPAQAAALFRQASLALGAIFAVLGLWFALLPSMWLWLFAPGLEGAARWLDGWMIYAIAAAIPLAALSGVSTAALNAHERFFVAGCGTLFFNLCVIVALLVAMMWAQGYLALLCMGILAGALLRWLSQWVALRASAPRGGGTHQGALLDRRLVRGFVAGLASASLLILVPVALRAGASCLGKGELAAFNYAIKLVELPLGILITTLATVAFPRLSQAHQQNDTRAFDALLRSSLQRSFVLSIAVVLCGWPFVDAVVAVLFGSGGVSSDGQAHISTLTQIALLSVPCVGICSLACAALNARRLPGVVLQRTVLVMLAFPFLCLPGLLLNEPVLLMWVLPLFHLILAASLMSAVAGARLRLGRAQLSRILLFLLVIGSVALAGKGGDMFVLKPLASLLPGPVDVWRVLFAGGVFAGAVAAGLLVLRSVNRSEG